MSYDKSCFFFTNVTALSVAFLMSHENKGFIFKTEKPVSPKTREKVRFFVKVIGLLRMKP